jgi:hypothetical protein
MSHHHSSQALLFIQGYLVTALNQSETRESKYFEQKIKEIQTYIKLYRIVCTHFNQDDKL